MANVRSMKAGTGGELLLGNACIESNSKQISG